MIRVELGTLPKKPVLLKLIYCFCKLPTSVPNQEVAPLSALLHFWFHHLPQDPSKIIMIICIRPGQRWESREGSPTESDTHGSLYSQANGPTSGAHKCKFCSATGMVGRRLAQFGEQSCWYFLLVFPHHLTHCSFSSYNSPLIVKSLLISQA